MAGQTEPIDVDKYALRIVLKLMPIIWQEIGYSRQDDYWIYDIPCQIMLGKFKRPNQPVFYYWVRKDKDYFYAGYGVFHYWDYVHFPLAKPFDEHKYDFEGFIIRVPKFNPLGKAPGQRQIITVCHHDFPVSICYGNQVWIELGGHGIHPGEYLGDNNPQKLCKNLLGIPIPPDAPDQKYWQMVEAAFVPHKVNLPWTWNHTDKDETKGRFWLDPDLLFQELIDRR